MGDTLNKGDSLNRGQSLENGNFKLTLQDDGNLVITDNGAPEWASNTAGSSAERATFQDDGNFVLYNGDGSAAWASDSKDRGGERITLQRDRNLVIYAGDQSVWATNTATDVPEEVPVEATAPVDAPPPPPAPRTYTVAPGDTLWAISERELGDGNRYQEIANLSGIDNPDLINPGQVLTLP